MCLSSRLVGACENHCSVRGPLDRPLAIFGTAAISSTTRFLGITRHAVGGKLPVSGRLRGASDGCVTRLLANKTRAVYPILETRCADAEWATSGAG